MRVSLYWFECRILQLLYKPLRFKKKKKRSGRTKCTQEFVAIFCFACHYRYNSMVTAVVSMSVTSHWLWWHYLDLEVEVPCWESRTINGSLFCACSEHSSLCVFVFYQELCLFFFVCVWSALNSKPTFCRGMGFLVSSISCQCRFNTLCTVLIHLCRNWDNYYRYSTCL